MREKELENMQDSTLTTIQTIIRSDPSIPEEQREHVLKACRQATPRKKRLGTVREAARILAVHPRTIQRWSRQSLLTAIRITPRKILFDLDQCEQLASEGVQNE